MAVRWLALVALGFAVLVAAPVLFLTPETIADQARTDWSGQGGDPGTCRLLSPAEAEPAWAGVLCGSAPNGLLYQANRFGRLNTVPLADPADAAQSTRP